MEETAIKMVILDAIEKGHTDPSELAAYMKTDIFKNAVLRYLDMLNTL